VVSNARGFLPNERAPWPSVVRNRPKAWVAKPTLHAPSQRVKFAGAEKTPAEIAGKTVRERLAPLAA
jgi:hypothetical protein